MSRHWLEPEVAIIGSGPAGLCAAIAAIESGADVLLMDRNQKPGGQLIKQTHMFFGAKAQFASIRGIDIAEMLINQIKAQYGNPTVSCRLMDQTTVLGLYKDGVLTAEQNESYYKIKPKTLIVATGASEKHMSFINNDLPGIYGAGAVQTLMNEYGVMPGQNALMVGSGNIGLIVSYQLAQAGVNVKAIVEAAPVIGGYLVHAAKIRRMGIPIHTSHTVIKAHGNESLERVTIARLDNSWKPVAGTEWDVNVDTLCVSVGLTPQAELLYQAGCEMIWIDELGGHVPVRNSDLRTSIPSIYVAGDVAGVEEASCAMVEGRLAGLCAAQALGHHVQGFSRLKEECLQQLRELRSGPMGERVRTGILNAIRAIPEETVC